MACRSDEIGLIDHKSCKIGIGRNLQMQGQIPPDYPCMVHPALSRDEFGLNEVKEGCEHVSGLCWAGTLGLDGNPRTPGLITNCGLKGRWVMQAFGMPV